MLQSDTIAGVFFHCSIRKSRRCFSSFSLQQRFYRNRLKCSLTCWFNLFRCHDIFVNLDLCLLSGFACCFPFVLINYHRELLPTYTVWEVTIKNRKQRSLTKAAEHHSKGQSPHCHSVWLSSITFSNTIDFIQWIWKVALTSFL